MKRLLLICTIIACASASFAQAGCSRTLTLFRFDHVSTPKDIYKLGTYPQFTFLRNLSTPSQFLATLMKKEKDPKFRKDMNEFNNLMVEIGFEHGMKDVKLSSITEEHIPTGTVGKMGSGNHSYMYARFAGANGFKAWKITSDKGCYVYIMGPCGNAFYPESASKEVQPVAMLDTREYQGNVVNEPKEEIKPIEELPDLKPARREEDCYCKFRRYYKAYYPYHTKKENRHRRIYGPGDYPTYCDASGCGVCYK